MDAAPPATGWQLVRLGRDRLPPETRGRSGRGGSKHLRHAAHIASAPCNVITVCVTTALPESTLAILESLLDIIYMTKQATSCSKVGDMPAIEINEENAERLAEALTDRLVDLRCQATISSGDVFSALQEIHSVPRPRIS